jgi:hypothetical protein
MHKCLFALTTALITSAPVGEGGCETPSDQQGATLKSMAARDEPGEIEPAISLAVTREAVDVPMADEGRIGARGLIASSRAGTNWKHPALLRLETRR